jgi:hypothetical protein
MAPHLIYMFLIHYSWSTAILQFPDPQQYYSLAESPVKCLLLLTSSAVWWNASFLWCTYTTTYLWHSVKYLCLCWSFQLSLHNESSVKETHTNISMRWALSRRARAHTQRTHTHTHTHIYHRNSHIMLWCIHIIGRSK